MDAQLIEWIRDKFMALSPDLDERGRRRWGAVEAMSLGWGGVALVAAATGMSDRTIRNGIIEVKSPPALASNRQRRAGGGRKANESKDPELLSALEALIEPGTRGDPESPLRWTCKSTRILSAELIRQGHVASRTKIGSLLKSLGYSLQSNRKAREGSDHPDRNEQFEHIAQRTKAQQRRGQPTISVDTKKKEVLGNLKNAGKIWRPKGNPIQVNTHDFPDKTKGKAIPYGIYDIKNNEAWVSVGVSHDTAEFAVASIRKWWSRLGRKRYSQATRLLIVADSGGSNGSRNRL